MASHVSRERGAVDPVEPGARHLHEAEPRRCGAHLGREREAHQGVDAGHAGGDLALGAEDDLGRGGQPGAYLVGQPDRERPGEGDPEPVQRRSCGHRALLVRRAYAPGRPAAITPDVMAHVR